MLKEWFIQIEGKSEGPYTLLELKRHPLITPDTLAWKEGLDTWQPIRKIAELREIFKDEGADEKKEEDESEADEQPLDQDVLALQFDPSGWVLWIFIALAVILYLSYLFYP